MRGNYVPEIDGLRAIAVLSVLFYHTGFTSFSGGYVGVDVFFVISGFLITRLIRDEVSRSGKFDFLNFYVRRVRRLFPALLATILASGILAVLLFSPQQMIRFSASAVAAVLSLSNFLFWWEADYFDAIAGTKPLLHTWSLSVEEQFYFLWPVTLVFLMTRLPRRAALIALAVLCVASLALAEFWIPRDRAGAFYLLPTRIVELGVGALLVWCVRFRPSGGMTLEALALLGFGLIGYACFRFTDQTPFPGMNALVPCIGAALVIFAASARWSGAALRSAPFVWIGKISYSLYLVHWPLVVFYEAFLFDRLGPGDRWVVVALSLALAAAQHRFVEERFRHVGAASLGGVPFLRRSAVAAVALFLAAGAVIASNGWPGRVPPERFVMTNRDQRRDVERRYCGRPDPAKPAELFTCQNYRGEDADILVWGDSHAMHLAPGFAKWFPDRNVHVLFEPACVPQMGFAGYAGPAGRQDCVERNRAVLETLVGLAPTTVVLSGAKRGRPETIAAASREIIDRLTAAGHRVVMLGDAIRPDRDLSDCVNVPGWLVSDARLAARCVANPETVADELAYNAALAGLVPQFVQINDLQCPEGACRFFHDGEVLFRDDHHLNILGAELFVGALVDRLALR